MNKTEATQLIRYLSGALIRVQCWDGTCEDFLKQDLNGFIDRLDEAYEREKQLKTKQTELTKD